MNALASLIGKIPPNPLWAQLLVEHEAERARDARRASGASRRSKVGAPRRSSRVPSRQQ